MKDHLQHIFIYIALAAISLMAASCHRSHHYPRELVVADSLCLHHKDSAIAILKRITNAEMYIGNSEFMKRQKKCISSRSKQTAYVKTRLT